MISGANSLDDLQHEHKTNVGGGGGVFAACQEADAGRCCSGDAMHERTRNARSRRVAMNPARPRPCKPLPALQVACLRGS